MDRFIELADYIEEHIPGVIVDGNPDGDPSVPGIFFVRLEDGRVLFDRLRLGRWPESGEVVALINGAMDMPDNGPAPGCG